MKERSTMNNRKPLKQLSMLLLIPSSLQRVCSWQSVVVSPIQRKRFSSSALTATKKLRGVDESERPYYPKRRELDKNLLINDSMGDGRPGAIIETEEQLAIKAKILKDMEAGKRKYPDWIKEYGELQDDEDADYDIDDPDAIDMATLGTWTIQDLRSKFPYEWDPNSDEPDPNIVEMNLEGVRYIDETEKNDDGVEVGYDPIFGPSNPIDTRTMLGSRESYMIDEKTRDDSMLTPLFPEGDPEREFNEDIVRFRKSLDILETYIDPFLPETMEIPRHVAKWHGYPEQTFLEPKNFTNNRFTDNPTNFNEMTPFRARQRAVELARAQNAEWLPEGKSRQWHAEQRQPCEKYNTLVGTVRKGECDPEVVEMIQPALQILGACAELLSIESGIFRFEYHGLIKNKFGMERWTETLLADCGVDVSNVIFETGFRKRDYAYDGGDRWNGPRT